MEYLIPWACGRGQAWMWISLPGSGFVPVKLALAKTETLSSNHSIPRLRKDKLYPLNGERRNFESE
jgi:hypothetical protein